MSEQWYAIVDENNELVSMGTVIATEEELAERKFTAIPLDINPQEAHPDGGRWEWHPPTKSFRQNDELETRLQELEFYKEQVTKLEEHVASLHNMRLKNNG